MKRVCFIGASIMEGMSDEGKLGMPGRLALLEASGDTPFIHYNLGVRGQTLREISARALNECKVRVIDPKSDFIVFATGSNDFAITETGIPRTPRHRAMKHFQELIEELKEFIPLLVLGPTPVDEEKMPFLSIQTGMNFDFKNNDLLEGTNEYQDICSKQRIPFLNLHQELIVSPDYMSGLKMNDGLHSTGMGYQAMALTVHRSDQWQELLSR
ncbi:SGNH/GDSL hydrolase family protein [Kiloniella antarctica]|uniref:SGNH/GDSL hydrolase family protein n=1 Tax=Kiloniella antarctica TaxID=1550907 RepID=A0ABW5BKD9_9PROT